MNLIKVSIPDLSINFFEYAQNEHSEKIILIRHENLNDFMLKKNIFNILIEFLIYKKMITGIVLSSFEKKQNDFFTSTLIYPYNQSDNCRFSFYDKSDEKEAIDEMDKIVDFFAFLKIKTKKQKKIQKENLTRTQKIITCNSENIKSEFFMLHTEDKVIGLAKFKGYYPYGSSGNDEADYIEVMLDIFTAYSNLDGLIVDFSDLDYEWGDDLTIQTYKFNKKNDPYFAIANEKQLKAFLGNGINTFAISLIEAIEKIKLYFQQQNHKTAKIADIK